MATSYGELVAADEDRVALRVHAVDRDVDEVRTRSVSGHLERRHADDPDLPSIGHVGGSRSHLHRTHRFGLLITVGIADLNDDVVLTGVMSADCSHKYPDVEGRRERPEAECPL